jgi:hypothetical protein
LTQIAGAEAVASALKPLLQRVAEVSRWRRAAIAAGCLLFPVLGSVVGLLGVSLMQQFSHRNPGLMELSTLLQTRASAALFSSKLLPRPTDRQTAVYIVSHYHGIITNETTWSSPLVLALIKGEARKFAEQSVAEHPAPTPKESKEAEEALGKQFKPGHEVFGNPLPPWLPAMVVAGALLCYGCLPVLLATLLFRGGLVLLIAGVAFVRKDGQRASRLRLLWRMLVAWSPMVLAFCLSILAITRHLTWGPWLALTLLALLAILSLVLPQRGLQDRLTGTWPVAR